MEEHVLYFSSLCPDTKAFVEELQRQNISYREVDITASKFKRIYSFKR